MEQILGLALKNRTLNYWKQIKRCKMKILTDKKLEWLLNEERKKTFQQLRVILAQINFEAQEVLKTQKLSKKAKMRIEKIIGLISQNM